MSKPRLSDAAKNALLSAADKLEDYQLHTDAGLLRDIALNGQTFAEWLGRPKGLPAEEAWGSNDKGSERSGQRPSDPEGDFLIDRANAALRLFEYHMIGASEQDGIIRLIGDLRDRVLAARSGEVTDAARLDWLQAHAMRDDNNDGAGVRVDRFQGTPTMRYADACFRARVWGETPLDDEGEPDYSRRHYSHTDHPTLREAIDAAMEKAGTLLPMRAPASEAK